VIMMFLIMPNVLCSQQTSLADAVIYQSHKMLQLSPYLKPRN